MTARCTCYRCNNTLTMAEALEEWCIVCQAPPRLHSSSEEIRESWARAALVAADDIARGSRKAAR